MMQMQAASEPIADGKVCSSIHARYCEGYRVLVTISDPKD